MAIQLDGSKLSYHVERVSDWIAGKDIAPLYLEIGPSRGCNQRCVHCYIGHLGFDGTNLEEDLFLRLVDDAAAMGVKGLQLAGCGEPLFNRSVPRVVRRAQQRGLSVALTTNGVLLKKAISEKILEHLSWVRFSILGFSRASFERLQGADSKQYDVLLRNIADATEWKAKAGLDTTLGAALYVFRENAHELYDFARRLKELGVDYIQLKCAGGTKQSNEDYYGDPMKRRSGMAADLRDTLIEIEKLSEPGFTAVVRADQFEFSDKEAGGVAAMGLPEGCKSLAFQCAVDSDGKVYACNGHWQDEQYCYGDLHLQPFSEIWHSEWRREITRRLGCQVSYEDCYYPCRHAASNELLWRLTHPPEHVDLI